MHAYILIFKSCLVQMVNESNVSLIRGSSSTEDFGNTGMHWKKCVSITC